MFEVQTRIGLGWENCWSVDDKPAFFSTYQEAVQAIDEHLEDAAEAARQGFLEEVYDREDYRVVPVEEGDDNVR